MKFVKNIFGDYIPQLSLHESLIFEILNSKKFRKRNSEEQGKVRKVLNSKYFKETLDGIENFVVGSSYDSEWGKDWFN